MKKLIIVFIFISKYKNPSKEVNIAMCGKYTELPDAYKSVLEAFIHAGVENDTRVNVNWISTEKIRDDKGAKKQFNNCDGILLLPGFGSRGSEEKFYHANMLEKIKFHF